MSKTISNKVLEGAALRCRDKLTKIWGKPVVSEVRIELKAIFKYSAAFYVDNEIKLLEATQTKIALYNWLHGVLAMAESMLEVK